MKRMGEGRRVSIGLPKRLRAWFAEHEERLQACGITGDVQ